MNEKYKKYIKNLPFVELFYNFNFVRRENKKFNDIVDIAIKSYSDIEKVKQLQKTKKLLNVVMWYVNIIMPILALFSGFIGYLILHNFFVYLVLIFLSISYYIISIYKDILEENEQFNNRVVKELIDTNATMTIWSYAYLSIGILLAMII